jgi:hypothetical protein
MEKTMTNSDDAWDKDLWDFVPDPDHIAKDYHRLTGKNFADLPRHIQERFALLPPDAELDDIEFVLDPPPHAVEGGVPRRYASKRSKKE